MINEEKSFFFILFSCFKITKLAIIDEDNYYNHMMTLKSDANAFESEKLISTSSSMSD
jgi:hypothetical protein